MITHFRLKHYNAFSVKYNIQPIKHFFCFSRNKWLSIQEENVRRLIYMAVEPPSFSPDQECYAGGASVNVTCSGNLYGSPVFEFCYYSNGSIGYWVQDPFPACECKSSFIDFFILSCLCHNFKYILL